MAEFWLVGGTLRDEIMGVGHKSKDLDYAVECQDYPTMIEAIKGFEGAEIYLETPTYLTVRANIPGMGAADFVLCRKEGDYSDQRRPDSVAPGTIYDDLNRRDFSCNALARNVATGELLDPHGGAADAVNRLLRAVGSAEARINEDPLRGLRALRFIVTHDMNPDQELWAVLRSKWFYDALLTSVSVDRIRAEMLRIVQSHNGSWRLYAVFQKYSPGLLRRILTETRIQIKPTLEEKLS